jgi:hypothetical protein
VGGRGPRHWTVALNGAQAIRCSARAPSIRTSTKSDFILLFRPGAGHGNHGGMNAAGGTSAPVSAPRRGASPYATLSILLLAGHVSTACGEPGDDSEGTAGGNLCMAVNGSRLRAMELRGDDGARLGLYSDWYDTKLGFECRSLPLADGVEHCMPKVRLAQAEGGGPDYLDFTCTRPVMPYGGNPCDPDPPAYGVATASVSIDSCERGIYRVYALGPSVERPVVAYRKTDAGACEPYDVIPDAWGGPTYYEVVEELPPDHFVSWKFEKRGARLQQRVPIGSDGTRGYAEYAAFDAKLDTWCGPALAADGVERCLPRGGHGTNGYADSACTQPVTFALPPDCRDSLESKTLYHLEAGELPASACSPQPRVHVSSVGDKAGVPDPIYVYSGPECTPTPNFDGQAYFPIGREVPPDTFVPFEMKEAACGPGMTSGTRLKAIVREAAGVRHPEYFRDSELGRICGVRPASDGVTRCLPGREVNVGYSDAACTRPAVGVTECHMDDHILLYAPDPTVDACAAKNFRVAVHTLGARLDGLSQVFVIDQTMTCAPWVDASRPIIHEIGPAIPPDRFVAFTETR